MFELRARKSVTRKSAVPDCHLDTHLKTRAQEDSFPVCLTKVGLPYAQRDMDHQLRKIGHLGSL